MLRFIHTADWQIGRQYSQFPPDDAVPLAAARLAAIDTIVRLATEHAVDAILVAGDVFDAQTVADRTIRKVLNALMGFAGPWVMIPGNHDAALTESVWTRAKRLGPIPVNLHLALEGQILDFSAQGFAVFAAPLTQRHTYTDLTEWFDHGETTAGVLRLGLAHGSVQGILADDIDSTNPIAADRAATARLDYLALGDWHGCKRIDGRTWYSGTPEPDRFKGNEPGHVLLVEIADSATDPLVTPLPTGQFAWQAWQQTLAVSSDADAFAARLASASAQDVLDITLNGQIDVAGLQRIRSELSDAESRVRSLRADLNALRLLPTAEDIAALKADGYLGEVIEALRDQQSGDDGEVAGHALGLLTNILAERQTTGARA